MQEYNLLPKLCELSNCLKRWSHRKLTLMGKITVVKTFALPKLIYPFTGLSDPTKQIINKLNSEIFSFIWDSKPDKIQRTRLYQDYKNGGLRLISLEHFIYSLKASWLKRIILQLAVVAVVVSQQPIRKNSISIITGPNV